jgi:hypothetical protein
MDSIGKNMFDIESNYNGQRLIFFFGYENRNYKY